MSWIGRTNACGAGGDTFSNRNALVCVKALGDSTITFAKGGVVNETLGPSDAIPVSEFNFSIIPTTTDEHTAFLQIDMEKFESVLKSFGLSSGTYTVTIGDWLSIMPGDIRSEEYTYASSSYTWSDWGIIYNRGSFTPNTEFFKIKIYNNTTYLWFYSISESNFGNWTVSAKKGTSVLSQSTVSINSIGEYDIRLFPDSLYILSGGRVLNDFDDIPFYDNYQYQTSVTWEHDTSMGWSVLGVGKRAVGYSTVYFAGKTDLTDYNYLVIDYQARGNYTSGVCPVLGIINNLRCYNTYSTFLLSKNLISANTANRTTQAVTYLDISGLSGYNHIGIQANSSTSYINEVIIYSLYLSKELPS